MTQQILQQPDAKWKVSLRLESEDPQKEYEKVRATIESIDGGCVSFPDGWPEDGQPLKVKIWKGDKAKNLFTAYECTVAPCQE